MYGLSGPLRLMALFALVVAAVSVACSHEAGTPALTAAVPQSASMDTATGGLPPTDESAPATSSSDSRNFGGFNLSPIAQMETTENEGENKAAEGKLTVSATGSETLVADVAYVVIVPERNYGLSGPEQLSADDRSDILEKLAEIGIAEEDVEFDYQGRYGETSVSVKLEPSEIAELSEAILDAVEEVVRRSEYYGLRFVLSAENCDRAMSLARRDAVSSAAKFADDLAQALGMEQGAVIAAQENPAPNRAYLLVGADDVSACNSQANDPYRNLFPFDADAEVEVSVNLEVTYLMQPADVEVSDAQ
ncbi:MAG: DUF541 domain-containing protein [Chloroflexi bacterium]|nr:DUF541 domain-containing protein [Chloroflexota bacterium]